MHGQSIKRKLSVLPKDLLLHSGVNEGTVGVSAYAVRVRGLPAEATEEDVRKHFDERYRLGLHTEAGGAISPTLMTDDGTLTTGTSETFTLEGVSPAAAEGRALLPILPHLSRIQDAPMFKFIYNIV